MQPMSAINTDVKVASTSAKSMNSSASESVNSFSTELDKQIATPQEANKNVAKSSEQTAEKTETQSKQEETVAEDGKNLPSEAKKDVESNAKSTKRDEKAVAKEDGKTTEERPVEFTLVTEQVTENNVETPVNKTKSETEKTDEAAQQSEVDSSQLAESSVNPILSVVPVTSSMSMEKNNADSQSSGVKMTTSTASEASAKSTQNESKVILSTNSDGAAGQSQTQQGGKESSSQNGGQEQTSSPIRSDILHAIKKQSYDGEGMMTQKNAIAAQIQETRQANSTSVTKESLIAIVDTKNNKAISTLNLNSTTGLTSVSNQQSVNTVSTSNTQTTTSLDIQPPVQSNSWSKVMTGRVVWMAKEGIQEAELKLNPAKMGPVDVKLHVQNDQVSVSFQAQHATTREALEQALPRLRDSFAENGMQLANADVGAQTQQEQRRDDSGQSGSAHIFSQATGSDDDIENESNLKQDLSESSAGLSIYA